MRQSEGERKIRRGRVRDKEQQGEKKKGIVRQSKGKRMSERKIARERRKRTCLFDSSYSQESKVRV